MLNLQNNIINTNTLAMPTMFEQLMNLPLFRGASHEKLAQIVGQTKLHFLKYPEGETIIRAGEPCHHLTFVLSGKVRAIIENANGRFSVGQTLSAPAVLSPDFLYGRYTSFPADITAKNDVSILKISKNDYTRILASDTVFMFNYLNAVSANAQKAVHGLLSLTTGEIDERIAFWIAALTQPGATEIVLKCRKRDLCTLFGTQRSAFEAGLLSMKERGLIDYTTNELSVIDREKLMALLVYNHEGAESSDEEYTTTE